MDNSNQKQADHANAWLSDHGQMSFGKLKNLAESGTAESLERLRGLADDNNISYGEATDPVQLAEQISAAMETDANTGVE
jgi:hypothetical protein